MIQNLLVREFLLNYTVNYIAINRLILDYFYLFFDKTFSLFLFISIVISLVYLLMTIMVLSSKKEERRWSFNADKSPFVTIQIPTKNEIIALRCAKRCLEFDYPRNRYEIIIGDDSTNKEVSDKLNKFASVHSKVRIIRRKKNVGFKPGNLNNMLKYSKGDIIVIFDSDFLPERDFLRRIVTPFLYDKEISAVQARWKFSNADKNIITALASTIVYTFHHVTLSLLKRYDLGLLCGSAEAVRKKDLIEFGGWKSGSLTEDIEYSLRLHKKGKKIHYLPELECFNEAPSRPVDLYKQQMRWAHGVVSSYRIHGADILRTNSLSSRHKLLTMVGAFGYLIPVVIALLFLTGTCSLLTHRPEPVDWARLIYELSRNVVLTSGLIIASSVSLYRARKMALWPKMMLSSFSIGLITTYYVNIGILKALSNQPMEWYLLNKTAYIDSENYIIKYRRNNRKR